MNRAAIAAVFTLAASAAFAAPVDLSGWSAVGTTSFNWVVDADKNGVVQTLNGNPTLFHNNENSQGKSLAGQIRVQTTSDDDFIGFVLGYRTGDITNPNADYILIDWKQSNQSLFGGTGLAGLAMSRVTGPLGNDSGAWWHDPNNNVTELARATTLGSTGWQDNQTYEFKLVFTANLIEVLVNGQKELSVAGTFSDGSFGFYNYSQQNVRYAGLTEDVLPPTTPVPLPAAAPMLLAALAGFGALRLRRARKG